jgi:coenzyme Q-binding protein COQ10
MAGATKSITVNVPPETLFDIITQYEKYPEFLPEVKGLKVERTGGQVICHYEVDLKIKTVKYSVKMSEQRPNRVAWSFVKGEFMKDNKGSWELKPAGEGKTEAVYNVEVSLGALVPKSIPTLLVETSLPAMLEQFKKRAEGR